ncbi:MAG: hypothetical protein P8123_04495, partial [bacterium]
MNKNLRWRIFFIFCVLAICMYYIYPTMRWAALSPTSRAELEEEWVRRDAEMSDEALPARISYSLEKWLRGDPR